MSNESRNEFERAASEKEVGIVAELWFFLRQNKKWWLAPTIIILLLFGVVLVLSSTALAPFIYTLF